MDAQHNPTLQDTSQNGLEIRRLAPVSQRMVVDFHYDGACDVVEAHVTRTDSGQVQRFAFDASARHLVLEPLWNDVEYQLTVVACRAGTEVARSRVRLFRLGHVPGTVINYIHPDDHAYMPSGRSPASPCIIRLPNGQLLASHDVYWGKAAQNLTLVFVSADEGASWAYASRIMPSFWTHLFCHRGALYAMGMDGEYGAIKLFRSDDWGRTWGDPVEIMPGGDRLAGGPHKAPMPIIEHKGRLWTAIDHGAWGLQHYHANGMISIGVEEDLMQAENWVCTGFLPYDPQWPGTAWGPSTGCIEGNAVISPDGRLLNFLRYGTQKCAPHIGLALLLEVDADRPMQLPRFHSVVKFPGNLSKFKVAYDPVSRRYWSLVSRVVTAELSQRNLLTLVSSADLAQWVLERDILNYVDNGWHEDASKVGFQYVDWIFDGDDLLALSRTALNNAYNYHNANYLTFHRIRSFRARGY